MTATVDAYPVAHGRCSHCGGVVGQWPPGRIIRALRAWAEANGGPPRSIDWRNGTLDHPSYNHVLSIFGTWNEALTAAGFTRPRRTREKLWPRERIIEAMLDWMAREGRWPTIRDWTTATDEHPTAWWTIAVFGSWNEARKAAGYTGKPRGHHYARARRESAA